MNQDRLFEVNYFIRSLRSRLNVGEIETASENEKDSTRKTP